VSASAARRWPVPAETLKTAIFRLLIDVKTYRKGSRGATQGGQWAKIVKTFMYFYRTLKK
jgi:hypothetical protein